MMTPCPFVSVVIPMRNEGKFIARCLHALLHSRYPPRRWEILVVDGESSDNSREEVMRVAAQAAVPVHLIDNPRRITPVAFNLAIARARGDLVIIVGAHAECRADFIERCVQVSQASGADNVGGPLRTDPGGETLMAGAIALAMAHPFGVGNSRFRTARQAGEVDTVPFGCFRKDVFQRLGLFDERLVRNQDYEMNQRIRRAGGRIYLDPRLECAYFSRPTLRSLLRQAWVNGFWNAQTHALHPYSFCPRHAIPALFTLGALLAVSLASWAWWGLPAWGWLLAWPLWGLYLLYVMVDVGVATGLARRHGWRYGLPLLLIFPVFHLVNGAGIAWGWVRVALHWHPWQAGDGIPTWQERHVETVR